MKYSLKRFALLVVVIVIASAATVYVFRPQFDKSVMWTKRNLATVRYRVSDYHGRFGDYPMSLHAIAVVDDSNDTAGGGLWSEYITSSQGCSEESGQLTGTGGWFYDPNTGIVKVNADKPLRKYIRFYFGPERNERPSDW
jgi:hypothetical protein